MVVPKASLKFKRLDAPKKVSFGDNVCKKLAEAVASPENPFTDLPFKPEDLKALNDALAAANAGMENGGKAASSALRKAKKDWDPAFTDTANYVTTVAQASDDVEGTILLAGYDPTKTSRSAKPLPGGIKDFSAVTNHKQGAITIGAKKSSDFAMGYLYTALPAGASVSYNESVVIISIGESDIYISVDTKKEIDMAMLPQGVVYNVSMLAFNSTGCGAAAAPQTVIPQGNNANNK